MLHYLNIYKIWQHKKFILPQQRNTTIELSNYKIAQNAKQSFSIAHNCVMINSSINFRLSFLATTHCLRPTQTHLAR